MVQWVDFEEAALVPARQARELIERFRFVLVGTIRRDGTPRISPVESHIVGGRLMLVMITGTLKANDLLRDPRILLHSPVTHPDDHNAESKLRGRAIELGDQALREATADALASAIAWRPPLGWHFFSIEIEDAAFIMWEGGELCMARWNHEYGLEHVRPRTAALDDSSGEAHGSASRGNEAAPSCIFFLLRGWVLSFSSRCSTCTCYLAYPFQIQEMNSHTGNLHVTDLLRILQSKRTDRVIIRAFLERIC
jgi:Pyridoxamine 5'-phosphate oxidase